MMGGNELQAGNNFTLNTASDKFLLTRSSFFCFFLALKSLKIYIAFSKVRIIISGSGREKISYFIYLVISVRLEFD